MNKEENGFTLAEVLITLTIVGIVAATTMPVLIDKIKDKQYDLARKKAIMSIGEAGRLLVVQEDIGSGRNAENFVKNYLSKKLKIVKMCDSNNLGKCGLSSTIKKLDGKTTMNMPKSQAELGLPELRTEATWYNVTNYGFLTAEGYAVNFFYNPNCTVDTKRDTIDAAGYACFNAIYDMNGLRNPNQVGKDIGFVTLFYPNETTKVVAPNPTPIKIKETYDNLQDAQIKCSNLGKDYTLPNKDELLSMAINGNLIGITTGGYLSSSNTGKWVVFFNSGFRARPSMPYYVRCVRR